MVTLARDFETREFGTRGLVACPECDLLQRRPAAVVTGTVACVRCDATLYRRVPHAIEATLALMLAAAVLFDVANAYPVMSLELQGRQTSETLFGLCRAMNHAGMTSIAALVFTTVILMPGLRIAAMLYMLVPLRLGFVPEQLGPVSRAFFAARPWSMVEVFVLGALVAIGRLGDLGRIELGTGLWSIGAVMFLFAVADSIFDERVLWDSADAVRTRGRP